MNERSECAGALMPVSPMARALELAMEGARAGEVPVGAVVVSASGEIVAGACNRVERDHDPSAHAEIIALREAGRLAGSPRLVGHDLYVTLEPCPMCAHAIALARIRRLYYGAEDEKGGGVDNGARIFSRTSCHHRPEVYGGIAAAAAAGLLRQFFRERR